jgi:polyphosphate kinase
VRQEILESYLADNVKSRFLQKDGSYVRAWRAQGKRKPPSGQAAFSAQDFLISLAEGKQTLQAIPAALSARSARTAVGKER